MSEITDIISQLKRDEGLRLQPYKDTRGFKTIGYGHNLDASPLPDKEVTEQQASDILVEDLSIIQNRLMADLPWIGGLPDVYAGVLFNMSFNMGVHGAELFHHMLADVQTENYVQASLDMKASIWYIQVGERAERLVLQMATGVWQ